MCEYEFLSITPYLELQYIQEPLGNVKYTIWGT